MHGRLKVKTTAEKAKEKALERKNKLQAFQGLTSLIMKDRADNKLNEDLLLKTQNILSANPDFYTLWNIRKEIFLKLRQENAEKTEELFKKELYFIVECLRVNPKSYGAWQQRCFAQLSMLNPDWLHELDLCSQFLQLDDRNFHCWDYRRFIVEHSGTSTKDEFNFTTSKIRADFSNFSSWHYRSSLLLRQEGGDICDETLHEELSLLRNALFTDPSDQSAWFYHGWLLCEKKKQVKLDWVVVGEGVVVLLFNQPLQIERDVLVQTSTQTPSSIRWKGANNRDFSRIFWAEVPKEGVVIEVCGGAVCRTKVEVTSQMLESKTPVIIESSLSKGMSETRRKLLEDHLQLLQQLQQEEPENKWIMMAVGQLVKLLDLPQDNFIGWLEELSERDYYRKNYYLDIVAKLRVEERLKDAISNKDGHLDLSSLDLNLITHHFLPFSNINLSYNHLHTVDLSHCIFIVELSLAHNKISNCSGFKTCYKLRRLNLSFNDIKQLQDLKGLKSLENIERVDLQGNKIAQVFSREDICSYLGGQTELVL